MLWHLGEKLWPNFKMGIIVCYWDNYSIYNQSISLNILFAFTGFFPKIVS